LVALVSVLGASFLKRQRMSLYQVVFNLSSIALSVLASWMVYHEALGSNSTTKIDAMVVPVLLASLVFYMVNSVSVAAVIALQHAKLIRTIWYENFLWSGPSYFAGGALGVLMAYFLSSSTRMSILLSLPFCYLIYYSYRLYLDRLQEKKSRIEVIEKANEELERNVNERTEALQRLNEQLQASNRQLAEANRLKSEFLANVSHELRTPLNAIIGFSELLEAEAFGTLTAEQREFINDIHGSGTNLLALINDILDLSKIEAGRMELQIDECEPASIVREAVAMVRLLASNKGIELAVEIGSEVGVIEADPAKLRQVLWNLLSNAIKFTPEWGSVKVQASRLGAALAFAVADTGIGIAPQDVDRIFDEFYQVDGSYARRYNGTGLGLALVKKFVELHGGTITVSSQLGRGSTFSFIIPERGTSACAGAAVDDQAVAAIGVAATARESIAAAGA